MAVAQALQLSISTDNDCHFSNRTDAKELDQVALKVQRLAQALVSPIPVAALESVSQASQPVSRLSQLSSL